MTTHAHHQTPKDCLYSVYSSFLHTGIIWIMQGILHVYMRKPVPNMYLVYCPLSVHTHCPATWQSNCRCLIPVRLHCDRERCHTVITTAIHHNTCHTYSPQVNSQQQHQQAQIACYCLLQTTHLHSSAGVFAQVGLTWWAATAPGREHFFGRHFTNTYITVHYDMYIDQRFSAITMFLVFCCTGCSYFIV